MEKYISRVWRWENDYNKEHSKYYKAKTGRKTGIGDDSPFYDKTKSISAKKELFQTESGGIGTVN